MPYFVGCKLQFKFSEQLQTSCDYTIKMLNMLIPQAGDFFVAKNILLKLWLWDGLTEFRYGSLGGYIELFNFFPPPLLCYLLHQTL